MIGYTVDEKTNENIPCINTVCGPGSVFGIATAYRLDSPGIESRLGRDFPHLSSHIVYWTG